MKPEDTSTIGVTVSHDCDCVADVSAEPTIDIIFAAPAETEQANWRYGRNPRRLQLAATDGSYFDLRIERRAQIQKISLVKTLPDSEISFSKESKDILARWLASRYDRSALPDSLQSRLEVVTEAVEKAGKKSPNNIRGIYIDFDPDEELHADDDLYTVAIVVVYRSDDELAVGTAEEAANSIRERFERKFKIPTQNGFKWEKVLLASCEAASDMQFTLLDALTYNLWRLEYISFRQEPPAERSNLR